MINKGIADCTNQMGNNLTVVDNIYHFQEKKIFYEFKKLLEQYFNVKLLDALFPYSDTYMLEDIYSAIYNSYIINSWNLQWVL